VRVVRDCPAAKWFPSRHRFALVRLMAFLRGKFRTPPRTDVDHIMLTIHRDQTAFEQYLLSAWFVVTATCYFAALLPPRWIAASLPLAALSIQLTIVLSGIGSLRGNHLRRNSAALFAAMTIASAYFALQTSPVRYVAWFFLATLVLNGVASVIMILLRDSVMKLEQQCET
jgi:hypothetical protein